MHQGGSSEVLVDQAPSPVNEIARLINGCFSGV